MSSLFGTATSTSAKVWSEFSGQERAVEQLAAAVAQREAGVQHAWLITGPPGSGRSNLAMAFAAALFCPEQGCGTCHSCNLVAAGTHPDISALRTDKIVITIDEVRKMVADSQFGGSMSKYRVMIIEDADRMAERSSNVLLKALEEPPAGTIWLLCAPSESDMLPTIRSRVRRVALRVPDTRAVADLLVQRDGIDRALAETVAAEAQSHIGMARRLATSSEARSRRRESLQVALSIRNVTDAVTAAAHWLEVAKRDSDALAAERDLEERANLLQALGLGPNDPVPANLRADFKQLDEAQKRRAARSLRDGIDRILVDLMALYRDVLVIQLGAAATLVNADLSEQLRNQAARSKPVVTVERLEAIAAARRQLESNGRDIYILDALAVALRNA